MREPLRHCTIGYQSGYGGLLLRLDAGEYGLSSRAACVSGAQFRPKSELHVTLLGSAKLRSVPPQVAAAMAADAALHSWRVDPGDEYWLLQNPKVGGDKTLASIIRMVDVHPLRQFFAQLNQHYPVAWQPPPTHITLYLRGGGGGIALNDHDRWRRLRQRRLSASELPSLNPPSAVTHHGSGEL